MRSRWLSGAVSAVVAAAGLTALAGAPASAAVQQVQFLTPTNEAQTWTVPAGVESIAVEIRGGAGGLGGKSGGAGGRGSRGLFDLPVTEGDTIRVIVGSRGAAAGGGKDDYGPGAGQGRPTAYAGGSGNTGSGSGGAGAGGGSASALWLNGALIAVAGGGGGGGGKGSFNGAGGEGGDGAANGADGGGDGTRGGGTVGAAGGTVGATGQNADTGSQGGGGGGGGGGYEGGGGGGGGALGAGGGGGGAGGTNFINDFIATMATDWAPTATAGGGAVVLSVGTRYPTSLAVTPTPGSATNREPLSFATGITAADPSGTETPQAPSGTVQMSVRDAVGDVTQIGTGSITSTGTSTGSATVFHSAGLPAGSDTRTTTDTPDGASDSRPTTTSAPFTVSRGQTTTKVTVPATSGVRGEPVELTARVAVTAPARGTPSGTVRFLADGSPLGDERPVTAGTASLTTTALPVGTTQVTAVYGGDPELEPSTSAATSYGIRGAGAAVTLSTARNPVALGDTVVVEAHVTSPATLAQGPSGQVQFYDGAEPVGTPVAVLPNGVATLRTTALLPGIHGLTARYLGDDDHRAAVSDRLDQVVNQGTTSVLLTSTTNPVQVGSDAVFDVAVEGTSGQSAPSGSVRLVVDGATLDVPATLGTDGRVRVTVPGLGVGAHAVVASYLGDVRHPAAASAPVVQRIAARRLTIDLVSMHNVSGPKQGVRVLARLRPADGSGPVAEGTVRYYENGKALGRPVPVSRGGWGGTVLHGLKPGPHRIVARFTPEDGSYYRTGVSNVLVQNVLRSAPTARLVTSVGERSGKVVVTVDARALVPGDVVRGTVVVRVGGRTRYVRLDAGQAEVVLPRSAADERAMVSLSSDRWLALGRLVRLRQP
jgi:hypothetical protein